MTKVLNLKKEKPSEKKNPNLYILEKILKGEKTRLILIIILFFFIFGFYLYTNYSYKRNFEETLEVR